MSARQKMLIYIMLFLLSSCAASVPPSSLQLSGMAMHLDRPTKGIDGMALSRDGSLLITVHNAQLSSHTATTGKGTLQLWDLLQGRQLKTIAVENLHVISSVAFSPDGKNAVLGGKPAGNQSSLGLWDLDSGKQIKTFPDLNKELQCVAYSPDGSLLLATHGSYVYLFDSETGEFQKQFETGHHTSILNPQQGILASFTPDGSYIVTGGPDAVLKMWDVESGQKIQHFAGHDKGLKGGITGIAVSADSQFLFTSAASDSLVRKWDISTAKQLQRVSGLDGFWHGVWGTALSPDDKYGFIASTPMAIWDLTTGKRAAQLQQGKPADAKPISDKPLAAFFHPNGKSLFLNGKDGSVRLFDTITGRELAMLASFDNDEWIIMTAEGYYNASKRGADNLSAVLAGKNFPVERFYDAFYRPDIVMAALQGQDVRNIAPVTMATAAQNPPPTVGFATLPGDSDQEVIKVCYQVSNAGGGIGEIRLFHNGKLLVSDGYYHEMVRSPSEKLHLMAMNGPAIHEQMRSVAINAGNTPIPISSHEKGQSFTDCKEIDTIPGKNEISITAFNKANTVQSPVQSIEFRSTKNPSSPHLYILSIGSNKYKDKAINLRYASKDASDFQLALGRKAATFYPASNIHQELLINEKANKAHILKKINELSAIVKPQDVFILFIAGHGILLQNQYYMLTSDFDGSLSEANTLSTNELVDISKKIKSLNQLFALDSCQAGGIDPIVSSLYEARIFVLAKKMGVPLFAFTNSVQEALDGYKGNGIFTNSLLAGLNNGQETDSDNDRSISITELGNYALQVATASAKKIGSQQTPLIINNGTNTPLYKLP